MDTAQVSFIIDAIKKQIEPPQDLVNRLIELVEKVSVVNTQMVTNQKELKKLISEEAVPAIKELNQSYEITVAEHDEITRILQEEIVKKLQLLSFADKELYDKVCKDVYEALNDERYDFKKVLKDLRENRVIEDVKDFVSFTRGIKKFFTITIKIIVALTTLGGLITAVYFIFNKWNGGS